MSIINSEYIKQFISNNQYTFTNGKGEEEVGYRSVRWDATDNFGRAVSAGMYVYTIQAGDFRQVRKMVLLK